MIILHILLILALAYVFMSFWVWVYMANDEMQHGNPDYPSFLDVLLLKN